MSEGRLQQVGTPNEIYDRPANRFVAQFVGNPPINMLDLTAEKPDRRRRHRAFVARVRGMPVDRHPARGDRDRTGRRQPVRESFSGPAEVTGILPTGRKLDRRTGDRGRQALPDDAPAAGGPARRACSLRREGAVAARLRRRRPPLGRSRDAARGHGNALIKPGRNDNDRQDVRRNHGPDGGRGTDREHGGGGGALRPAGPDRRRRGRAADQRLSNTGKIVEQAEAFTKNYGVQATGTKANAAAQLEMVIREAQAGNVQGDVMQISDVAAGVAQLLPEGFVDELGAARSRGQDRSTLSEPARHRQRGERLGLQHPSLRQVSDREHVAADRA